MTTCANEQHEHHTLYSAQCEGRALLALLANKWSTMTIGALEEGPQRFSELERKMQGIGPRTLTQTLRRLQESGFVFRTAYPDGSPHVEYALTERGCSAAAPLGMLRSWAEGHIDDMATPPAESAATGSSVLIPKPLRP